MWYTGHKNKTKIYYEDYHIHVHCCDEHYNIIATSINSYIFTDFLLEKANILT